MLILVNTLHTSLKYIFCNTRTLKLTLGDICLNFIEFINLVRFKMLFVNISRGAFMVRGV